MKETMLSEKISEPVVSRENSPEFIGQIIDIFEDFLDRKGIIIENDEKDDPNLEEGSAANIYGTDYGDLQTDLEDMMVNWNVMERR